MKTTDPRDPLDQKIDELLASQPVKTPTDFSARVLANIKEEPQRNKSGALAPLLRFALPLAAAIALAFVVIGQLSDDSTNTPTRIAGSQMIELSSPETENDDEALNNYEIQEIMLLKEGLSGFAQVESDELSSSELLDTLDTLYSI